MLYNADDNVMQFCDGTDWIAAGEINPSAGSGGCSGPAGIEGETIYNTDYKVVQFCNGEDWIAMGRGYCTACSGASLNGPAGCPNIGDVCADGTVFAGFHPTLHEHLFIPPTDQERPGSPGTYTMNWKNAIGTDDVFRRGKVTPVAG